MWEAFRNKLKKHSVTKNCSDLSLFGWTVANSRPSVSNFKTFSQSLKQFFLTVGQNNFGNKIPFGTSNFFLHNMKIWLLMSSTKQIKRNAVSLHISQLVWWQLIFLIISLLFYCRTNHHLHCPVETYIQWPQCYRQWVYTAPFCITIRIKTWVGEN